MSRALQSSRKQEYKQCRASIKKLESTKADAVLKFVKEEEVAVWKSIKEYRNYYGGAALLVEATVLAQHHTHCLNCIDNKVSVRVCIMSNYGTCSVFEH